MPACPWCREALPALRTPEACPTCGKPLVDAAGARLRPLDLDFEAILADADARSSLWLRRGAIWAACLAVAAQASLLVPGPGTILLVVASVALSLSQLFWGRFFMARHYARHFGPVRRMVTRWLTRLGVILLVLPAHASVAIPVAGLVISPAVFTGTNWALRAYFRLHLAREHRREGVLWFEKIAVVLAACVLLVVLCVFGALAWAGFSLFGGAAK